MMIAISEMVYSLESIVILKWMGICFSEAIHSLEYRCFEAELDCLLDAVYSLENRRLEWI